MLTVAETYWEVISGLVALILGGAFAFWQRDIFKISLTKAFFLYFWHSSLCIYYMLFSLDSISDSTTYYIYSLTYNQGFSVGTSGVEMFTSIFSRVLGMSYGGTFFVYNIFGFVGMIALASALQELIARQDFPRPKLVFWTLLLPGLSFWSSAIGKDAISFMGVGLACWAMLELGRRYPAMILAVLLVLFVRPHIAGMMLMSLAAALAFGLNIGARQKALLLLATIPIAFFSVQYGIEFAGLGSAAGIGDLQDYIEERQAANFEGTGAINIAALSIPERMFAYLFRPLFFDATGMMGLAASFENAFILFLMTWFGIRIFKSRSSLEAAPRLFFAIYATVALLILANSTANLGISIRQKWMFLPMLLMLAFSYLGEKPKAARY